MRLARRRPAAFLVGFFRELPTTKTKYAFVAATWDNGQRVTRVAPAFGL